MDLSLIYRNLIKINAIDSQYSFDELLGRSYGHFAYKKCANELPTKDTLIQLYINLNRYMDKEDIPDQEQHLLNEINSYIWNYIESNTPSAT